MVVAVSVAGILAWPLIYPLAVIEHRTLNVDGVNREYRFALPSSLKQATNIPLVIALHGALDTVDDAAKYSQLDQFAASNRVAVAYLQGRMLNWPPSIPDENPDVAKPDLNFFDQVIDQLVQSDRIDAKRVYVVGVSQGGCMCNLIVAKRSERIAAAVCICGWMPKPLDATPLNTQNKCPLLFIVGSEDSQVPPDNVRTAMQVFEREGHPVEFKLIDGAGHGWNAQLGTNQFIETFLKQYGL